MSQAIVYQRVNRVEATLCQKAMQVTVADLHESTAHLGYVGLMSHRMKRITPSAKVAGPAVTALCQPGDNLMMHRALRLAQAGDVLVVHCQSETSAAQWGDVATSYAKAIGLAGVVVQGCVRDIDGVIAMGFPVWSTCVWPVHADKGKGGGVNIPISCADVLVRPGDLIVADGDGVIAIAKQHAASVIQAAQAKMQRESDIALKIQAGSSAWELSGAAQSYEHLKVQEHDAAFDD